MGRFTRTNDELFEIGSVHIVRFQKNREGNGLVAGWRLHRLNRYYFPINLQEFPGWDEDDLYECEVVEQVKFHARVRLLRQLDRGADYRSRNEAEAKVRLLSETWWKASKDLALDLGIQEHMVQSELGCSDEELKVLVEPYFQARLSGKRLYHVADYKGRQITKYQEIN